MTRDVDGNLNGPVGATIIQFLLHQTAIKSHVQGVRHSWVGYLYRIVCGAISITFRVLPVNLQTKLIQDIRYQCDFTNSQKLPHRFIEQKLSFALPPPPPPCPFRNNLECKDKTAFV